MASLWVCNVLRTWLNLPLRRLASGPVGESLQKQVTNELLQQTKLSKPSISKDLERDGIIPEGGASIVSKSTITNRRLPLALLLRIQKSLKGFDPSLQSALATPSCRVPGILALLSNDVYVFLDDSEKAEQRGCSYVLNERAQRKTNQSISLQPTNQQP